MTSAIPRKIGAYVDQHKHSYEEILETTQFGQRLTMTCECGRQLQLLLDQESYWRNKIAGELEGLPRLTRFIDDSELIDRADAIAIARGGGESATK